MCLCIHAHTFVHVNEGACVSHAHEELRAQPPVPVLSFLHV